MKNRYLIKLLATIISSLFNAFILFLVPKSIGPESFGIYNYILNIFNQIIGVLDGGTSTAFYTKLSQRNEEKKLISFYFLFSLFVFLVLFLILFVILLTDNINYIFMSNNIHYIVKVFLISFLIWFTRVHIKIMDSFAFTIYSESIKILYVIISLLLLITIDYLYKITLNIFLDFLIFNSLLYNIMLIIVTKIKVKWSFNLSYHNIKAYIKEFYLYTHPLFITMIIGAGVTILDFWLLQKYAGSKEQGYYALSFQIASMSFILISAMTPIITREFAKAYQQNKLLRMKLLFKKYIPSFYILATFFSIFVSYYSSFFVDFFGGDDYSSAIVILSIIALYPMHQTYGQLSGAIFFSTNKTQQYRNIAIFFMIVGLFLSILLIYFLKLGAVGLALKIIVIQILAVNYQLYLNCNYLNISFIKFLIHQAITPLFFLLVVSFFDIFLPITNSLSKIVIVFIFYLLIPLIIFQIRRKNEFIQKIQFL
jgi:O-antigen/teichoic acid export membrane protein